MKWIIAVIAALTAWRLSIAALLPVTQDEAYYFDWARHLAWGYFDHPPGVALLGVTTWLESGSAFAARLGGISAGMLTLWLLARFYRRCGLTEQRDVVLALLLVGATLPGLIGGVITTPDTALMLGWALALHESERALAGDRRHWLTAGAAMGLGLLGKYTMVLIGPVVLWAIIRSDWRALRTPWPYLGAVLALVVFAPNIIWNANHDWLTMRFQLGHGLSTDVGVVAALPPATMALGERFASVAEYLATQLAFWGVIALVLVLRLNPFQLPLFDKSPPPPLFQRGENKSNLLKGEHEKPPLEKGGLGGFNHAPPLLFAATLFPLGFFAVIASFSSVEANWPAMYLLTAAPLLTLWLRDWRCWLIGAAVANVLLVTVYAVHAATGALPLPNTLNRILRETHGFAELAELVDTLNAPVFADRYQTTALLRFYQPARAISQWPELSRPSEYLRGEIAPRVEPATLQQPFWLVTRRAIPPALTGFVCTTERRVFDCALLPVQETTLAPCPRPLHVWQLYRYERAPNSVH
ncbi:glycosyltransferase [Chromatium weissei]|nr:glycosyltransferase [Chromatium weissei]